jgi:uncharacterized protein YlxP (DUF503 family)
MPQTRRSSQPSIGHDFTVGLIEIDLLLPECSSLKTKRGVLARVMNGLRKHYPISIAEVGDQDVWGRAGLAAVVISSDEAAARRILDDVAAALARSREVELLHHQIEVM